MKTTLEVIYTDAGESRLVNIDFKSANISINIQQLTNP